MSAMSPPRPLFLPLALLPPTTLHLHLNASPSRPGRLRLRLVPAALSIQADTSSSSSSSSIFPFQLLSGAPQPLGATATATASDAGVNFALYSSAATAVSLCLFTLPDLHAGKPTLVIPLDPATNKTGHVWHIHLSPNPSPSPSQEDAYQLRDMLYGYQLNGPFCPHQGHYFHPSNLLLDPYAKAVLSRQTYGVPAPPPPPAPSSPAEPKTSSCWPQMAGMIPSPNSDDDDFDWQGDTPLHLPHKDLLIYEMHVRGFTNHDSSSVPHPGTYASATQKLHHLKVLTTT